MKKIKIVVGVTSNPKSIIDRTMDSFNTEGIPCHMHLVNTFETSACEITYIDTKHTTQSLYDIKERYNPDVCCGTINIDNILYIPYGSPFHNFVKLEAKIFNDYHKKTTIEESECCENDVGTLISSNYAKEYGFGIEKVIFNDPATIVLWNDGTKTVVKAEDEEFDEEKGLAMAISKKVLGNKGNYYDMFKKWLPESQIDLSDWGTSIAEVIESMKRFNETMRNVKSDKECDKNLKKVQTLASETTVNNRKQPSNVALLDIIHRYNGTYGGYCSVCGSPVNSTSDFCPKCGQKLDWSKWKGKDNE